MVHIPSQHGYLGYMMFYATVGLTAISTIVVALRVWARYLSRAFGVDDWLMLFAWALLMLEPFAIAYARAGEFRRELTHEAYAQGLKWNFFVGILYTINAAVLKCSICFYMLRIVRQKLYRWVFKGVMAVTVVASLIRILVWLCRCESVQDAWKEGREDKCGSPDMLIHVTIFFSVVCIITDLTCAVIPGVVVMRLQLGRKEKTYVCIMLAFGLSATIATIVRIQWLFRYKNSEDVLWQLAPIAFFSNLELVFGIIAACIATMRPLLRYVPRLGAGMNSDGSKRRPFSCHRLRRLGEDPPKNTEQIALRERRSSMQISDSEAPMLPPAARVKDDKRLVYYTYKEDPVTGAAP